MTDRLNDLQHRASQLAAKVEKLAASLARRPSDKKADALTRMQVRMAKANAAVANLRQRQAERARRDVLVAGMTRRLDALAADAPKIMKKWREDRAKEPKRLKKLKAAIEKRTSKDKTARPDWMRRPVALPPPIEQPQDIDLAIEELPPPREGLIPGTYTYRDPATLAPLLDAEPLPKSWTAYHVGRRLIDAHATLRCMPERGKPKGYGALWPAYKNEAGELAIQAGAGTLFLGRNRVRRVPSGDEVALMEEALTWVGQFLSGSNAWARIALISWAESRHRDEDPFDDPSTPIELLEFIANALNAERRVVR